MLTLGFEVSSNSSYVLRIEERSYTWADVLEAKQHVRQYRLTFGEDKFQQWVAQLIDSGATQSPASEEAKEQALLLLLATSGAALTLIEMNAFVYLAKARTSRVIKSRNPGLMAKGLVKVPMPWAKDDSWDKYYVRFDTPVVQDFYFLGSRWSFNALNDIQTNGIDL